MTAYDAPTVEGFLALLGDCPQQAPPDPKCGGFKSWTTTRGR